MTGRSPGRPIGRAWRLLYADTVGGDPHDEGDGEFLVLEDPMDFTIEWTYTDQWDIATIADKEGHATAYTYGIWTGSGRLTMVTDPTPIDQPDPPAPPVLPLAQLLAYSAADATSQPTTYTDRRGEDWVFTFNKFNTNLIEVEDPLLHTQSLAYDDPRPQLVHERTAYTNALGKTWGAGYDPDGNVESATDPLGNAWAYTYDGLNNLLTITPPGETPGSSNPAKQVSYDYNDEDHPTSPTQVNLPDDGQGNPPASIQLAYYGPDEPTLVGLLETVTDPNGVGTLYEYDSYGQQWRTTEGALDEAGWEKVVFAAIHDEVGRVLRDYGRYTGDYPEPEGDGGDRWCRFMICSNWDDANRTDSCCCCVVPHFLPRQPECDGDGDGGDSPPPDGGGRDSAFACQPFRMNSEAKGPSHFDYDKMNRMTGVETTFWDDSLLFTPPFDVNATQAFDELGRLTASTLTTNEPTFDTALWDTQITRGFTYQHDATTGQYDRTGPDGQLSHAQTDAAGRLQSISRDAMSASYTYYVTGNVESATFGNGTRTLYQYDDAGRTTQIRHEWTADQSVILQLDYAHSADGLVTAITETGPDGWAATVTFDYDNRNRLIEEERIGSHPYHLSYTYDQVGNRQIKTDWLSGVSTVYHYDVDDPATYESRNNRLMYYEVFDGPTLVERVDYEYYAVEDGAQGHPSRVVRKREDETFYRGVSLDYNKQGEIWFASEQTWERVWDEELGWMCINKQLLGITEYRGNGRSRYMVRQRDPQSPLDVLPGTSRWSDYDGDEIYGDYIVNAFGQAHETTAYLPGIAQMAAQTTQVQYFHSDQIGTLRAVTTEPGVPAQMIVQTAFGEPVCGSNGAGDCVPGIPPVETRYQYAGAWGYESPQDTDVLSTLGWLHVGHRYYDPSTGRFPQRDPVGLLGGLNVYVYVGNNPLIFVDPQGLLSISWTGIKTSVARGYIWITGGRESWMDDEDTVQTVSDVAAVVGLTCGTAGLGLMAAGGTAVTGAVVEAVTAEVATGVAYRGGVKLTVYVFWNGKWYIRDVIMRAGKIIHEHWKNRPPWPPIPPFLN